MSTSTSTRLFLVRHGESIWNATGRVQGQADPPLSERGVAQACSLADVLSARPVTAIYSSPLWRARATASYIAAPHALKPRIEDRLREVHLGAWQGRTLADLDVAADGLAGAGRSRSSLAAGPAEPPSALVAAPGGEGLAEALDRVAPALDALLEAHRGQTLVVVAHTIIGRVIICHLLRAGLDLVPRLKLKQASLSMLRLDAGGAVLERLGDTNHLRQIDVTATRAGAPRARGPLGARA